MPDIAIITTFLGQTRDRFHAYNQPATLAQKFDMVAGIDGCDGVEIVYPYEVNDPAETKELLNERGLNVAAVNVNVKGEPEFISGGLSSPDAAVRRKAIGLIKDAKDFAIQLGAPHVTCCPLADGFEFPFQTDYRTSWNHLCDSLAEAGDYRSDEMGLYIEYKPKETRRITYLPRAADVLYMLNRIRVPNMGVTMDYGHSIYAGENPSMTLCLLAESEYDYYVHINDNDKSWDWDYFCGSHTYLEYVEFVYYLKKLNYKKYLTSDTQPTRWDLIRMFEVNSRMTNRIWNLIDEIGTDEFEQVLTQTDYMDTWKFIEDRILKLG